MKNADNLNPGFLFRVQDMNNPLVELMDHLMAKGEYALNECKLDEFNFIFTMYDDLNVLGMEAEYFLIDKNGEELFKQAAIHANPDHKILATVHLFTGCLRLLDGSEGDDAICMVTQTIFGDHCMSHCRIKDGITTQWMELGDPKSALGGDLASIFDPQFIGSQIGDA